MTVRAVIFDLGGTLLHYSDPLADDPARPFRRLTRASINAVLDHLAGDGYKFGDRGALLDRADWHIGTSYRADWEARRGGSIEPPIRAALAEAGYDVPDEVWQSARLALYGPIHAVVEPREGVPGVLAGLAEAGYALGLISNTHWAADIHDRHLAEHGLLNLLPVRLYSCDTPYMKPHPGIFQSALEQMALPAAEAVYVGDRPDVDVDAAQQAGLRGILIHSPYRTEFGDDFGGVKPDAAIDELTELPAALDALAAR